MKRHPPAGTAQRTRHLRSNTTHAERAMWRVLREHFADARFRRQVPIRQYIADFASHNAKLVIEVDGGQHSEEIDRERTAVIEADGYRVLRFWNNDVLNNPEGVSAVIAGAIGEVTPTQPSPIKGEGYPKLVADEEDWSLPAWTYDDPGFLALERERIFLPAWHLVCHLSEIPKPGDWRSFAMLGELAIVVRGKDGEVRGFHNVCRHRAARLLDGEGGHCPGRITCPYHGWSYALDGRLTGVPFEQDYPNFDRADHGLAEIECALFAGFVFVRFHPGGPALAEEMAPVAAETALYRFAEMAPLVPVRSRVREVNWKTACDNYVDALHIRTAHPGLDSLVRDSYRLAVEDGADKIFANIDQSGRTGPSVEAYRRMLPEAEHLPPERRRMWTYWKLWPNLMFDVYPDQIDFMQFIPVSPTRSILRDGAYALPDGRREMRAARYLNQRINREVNAEDSALIERVQAGMASSSFAQGPLGRSEICLRHFARRMREALPIARERERPAAARLEAARDA